MQRLTLLIILLASPSICGAQLVNPRNLHPRATGRRLFAQTARESPIWAHGSFSDQSAGDNVEDIATCVAAISGLMASVTNLLGSFSFLVATSIISQTTKIISKCESVKTINLGANCGTAIEKCSAFLKDSWLDFFNMYNINEAVAAYMTLYQKLKDVPLSCVDQ